ncbi:hypothetical protein DFP83_105117 [Idiomarina fontislapidosi]|nr:hypothetical protein DFP83_105117 [Idiomarina fontislapidosi]
MRNFILVGLIIAFSQQAIALVNPPTRCKLGPVQGASISVKGD